MYNDEEKNKSVYFINLGCPKNEVDGHIWVSHLSGSGFEIIQRPEQADFLFVNTCAFIEDARKESQEIIENLCRIKDESNNKKLFVVGCWAQKDREKLYERFPFIDGVLGNLDIGAAVNFFVHNCNGQKHLTHIPRKAAPWYPLTNSIPKTFPYAYLKIADGCDNNCAYCIIPKIKKSSRSIPLDILLEQAKFLVSNDFKEIILIAQDTTRYGQDLDGDENADLTILLEKLNEIEGDFLIRVMYLHPLRVTRKLVETICRLPKVIKYLDIPIQHYDSEILQKMGRGYDSEYIDELLDMIHSIDEEIVLRTSLMVGFPGETDVHFENLLNFMSKDKFLHSGVFQYSLELGTPAAQFASRVPNDIASLRKELLEMTHDQSLLEKNQRLIGGVFDALVEGDAIRDGFSIARMFQDAPQIDRHVKFQGIREAGEIVKVRIIGALTHDFLGIIEE